MSMNAPLSEQELENRIDWAALRLSTARTPAARRMAWKMLQDLVKQRSPGRVKQMEQGMGL
jgi:hypothetical protein